MGLQTKYKTTINSDEKFIIINDLIKYYSDNIYPINSSTICIHKSVFQKVGYFAEGENLGEDIDMWIRISFIFNILYINEILSYYNCGATNRACVRNVPQGKFVFIETLQKHIQNHELSSCELKAIHKFISEQLLNIAAINIMSGNSHEGRKYLDYVNCRFRLLRLLKLLLLSLLPKKLVTIIDAYLVKKIGK